MKYCFFIISSLLLIVSAAQAAFSVASSSNYWLVADSLNFAGTTSGSASYKINDTAGELGSGVASSTSYQISAGYQAMLGAPLSITLPSDVTLSPNLETNEGGTANGSAVWYVTSPAGYSLAVRASTDPALRSSGQSFSDYNGAPDFNWLIGSDSSAFGFSPEGTDISTTYKNDGTTCGTGSSTSGHCWDGFSTSDQTIASRSTGPNSSRGTTLQLRAEIGEDKSQARGPYSATIITTAVGI